MTRPDAESLLTGTWIDPAVFGLRPDYRAIIMTATGIEPGVPADAALIAAAESAARDALSHTPVEELPHVAAWREAYRAFGAKPQRTRNSVEALMRRLDEGLPRVNPLTDLYNAVSIRFQIPIGGEDLTKYQGAPRLIRAHGNEAFETTDSGQPCVEYPEVGEVVWADDAGVTCRRWNWRQSIRTRLTDETTDALFIFDALDPLPTTTLQSAADLLAQGLATMGSGVSISRRLLSEE